MNKRGNPWPWLRILLGSLLALALIVWVEQRLGWAQLLGSWRAFPPTLLLLVLGLSLLGYSLRARRFHLLVQQETGASFAAILAINIWHTTAINWLPMRLGEAVFPWLMKKMFNHSMLQSGGSLLWIRLLDLFALLWLSMMIWAGYQAPEFLLPTSTLLGLIPLGWWLHRHLQNRLQKHEQGWKHLLYRILAGFPDRAALYARLSALTLAAWALKLGAFLLVASQFSHLGFGELLPGVMLAELASSLPLQGLAGFGTYEAAMVMGLSWSHSEPIHGAVLNALLAVAVNLHLFILASSLLFSLLAGLVYAVAKRKTA